MVEKTVRTVENVRLGFIEQLLDVEELESKQAPSDQVMLPAPCHNHNETLVHDSTVPIEPLVIELDVEELESKQAPSDQVMLPGGCHNHNETLLRKD
jgi:hypothetical protein